MLGLVLLYWIGKYFFRLAEDYDKSKWGFAILGIVVYYSGIIIFGFIFGIVAEMISPGFLDDFNETVLGLIALPFGLLSCYLLYYYLQKSWKEKKNTYKSEIDKIGQ